MAPLSTTRSLNPKGTWRTYTTTEGLAGLQTEHIAEDAEGYLWVGTWDSGASHFDGDEFRTFTKKDGLPSNLVYATLLDRQGKLWLGTGGGACWYDGRTFHRFGEERGIGDQAVSFRWSGRARSGRARGWGWPLPRGR